MRSKFNLENDDEWQCGFCCHVRTGTILLGIWHLVLHILALLIIAVVFIHPELVSQIRDDDIDGNAYLYSQPEKDRAYEYSSFFKNCKWTAHDLNLGMAVTFCTLLITILMIMGAIKGNPRYLMPFFCIQVFDFCIASLKVIGYFSYMPDVRQTISENPSIPFKKELMKLDTQWLSLIVLLTFIGVMLIKAYFIGVVWSCYKYLIYRKAALGVAEFVGVDSQILIPPPDYDTIAKDSKQEFMAYFGQPTVHPAPPPPPYTPREETI